MKLKLKIGFLYSSTENIQEIYKKYTGARFYTLGDNREIMCTT